MTFLQNKFAYHLQELVDLDHANILSGHLKYFGGELQS